MPGVLEVAGAEAGEAPEILPRSPSQAGAGHHAAGRPAAAVRAVADPVAVALADLVADVVAREDQAADAARMASLHLAIAPGAGEARSGRPV